MSEFDGGVSPQITRRDLAKILVHFGEADDKLLADLQEASVHQHELEYALWSFAQQKEKSGLVVRKPASWLLSVIWARRRERKLGANRGGLLLQGLRLGCHLRLLQ